MKHIYILKEYLELLINIICLYPHGEDTHAHFAQRCVYPRSSVARLLIQHSLKPRYTYISINRGTPCETISLHRGISWRGKWNLSTGFNVPTGTVKKSYDQGKAGARA